MSKQLLIEEAEFTTPIKIEKGLKESISLENNKDVLIVRNIPATIADRKNQNGRIYTTEVLQEAIKNANFQLKTKWMYSQADEHPEGSFVKPSHASHVVINAYIKKNVKVFVEGKTERHNVMFMDWEILNTEEGKNLKALILQETACPTSIRGLGDMEGDYVTNYELLGCDVVSNPSSGTSMRMPVSESIKVESSDKSYLDESFEVVSVSNDVVSDVEAAAQKQIDIENAKYGTITNIKTKLDQEIDPKTHAETTITNIEATTTDEVSSLDQALQMAKTAFVNPVSKMDSVTITFVDDAEKAKESVEDDYSEVLDEKEEKCPCCGKEPCECDDNCECKEKDVNSEKKESVDDTIVSGLKDAIQQLNNMILSEKDPENQKKLEMNRNELEKLLRKNNDKKEEPLSNNDTISEDLDSNEGEIEQDDNKLIVHLSDDDTVEKEFDNDKIATIAKDGIENGKVDPSIVVQDSVNEKLYKQPSEPSDDFVKKPLKDNNSSIEVVISNIEYNTNDEQELSELPTETKFNLDVDNNIDFNNVEDLEKYIIANSSIATGLPIKNADVKSITFDFDNSPKESTITEEDKQAEKFTIYTFIDGKLIKEEDFEDIDNALDKAKEFENKFVSSNTDNFQIVVTRTDSNGIEDFDKLVYQYPEIKIDNDISLETENTENIESDDYYDYGDHLRDATEEDVNDLYKILKNESFLKTDRQGKYFIIKYEKYLEKFNENMPVYYILNDGIYNLIGTQDYFCGFYVANGLYYFDKNQVDISQIKDNLVKVANDQEEVYDFTHQN